MRLSHPFFCKGNHIDSFPFPLQKALNKKDINPEESLNKNDMTPYHFFPFKAFLRANIVLKKAFS